MGSTESSRAEGKQIRTARLERGWTQVELAQAAKVQSWYVSEVERGIEHEDARKTELRRALGLKARYEVPKPPQHLEDSEIEERHLPCGCIDHIGVNFAKCPEQHKHKTELTVAGEFFEEKRQRDEEAAGEVALEVMELAEMDDETSVDEALEEELCECDKPSERENPHRHKRDRVCSDYEHAQFVEAIRDAHVLSDAEWVAKYRDKMTEDQIAAMNARASQDAQAGPKEEKVLQCYRCRSEFVDDPNSIDTKCPDCGSDSWTKVKLFTEEPMVEAPPEDARDVRWVEPGGRPTWVEMEPPVMRPGEELAHRLFGKGGARKSQPLSMVDLALLASSIALLVIVVAVVVAIFG
jgi:transcriptional regulator with XRE-family HTH domain/DNA-directed RNA polymerase subunit RPC12/RpoP